MSLPPYFKSFGLVPGYVGPLPAPWALCVCQSEAITSLYKPLNILNCAHPDALVLRSGSAESGDQPVTAAKLWQDSGGLRNREAAPWLYVNDRLDLKLTAAHQPMGRPGSLTAQRTIQDKEIQAAQGPAWGPGAILRCDNGTWWIAPGPKEVLIVQISDLGPKHQVTVLSWWNPQEREPDLVTYDTSMPRLAMALSHDQRMDEWVAEVTHGAGYKRNRENPAVDAMNATIDGVLEKLYLFLAANPVPPEGALPVFRYQTDDPWVRWLIETAAQVQKTFTPEFV